MWHITCKLEIRIELRFLLFSPSQYNLEHIVCQIRNNLIYFINSPILYGGSILNITYCYPHNDLQVSKTNRNCLCYSFYATSIHYSHKTLNFQVNMLRQILILNKITTQIPQRLIKDWNFFLQIPAQKPFSNDNVNNQLCLDCSPLMFVKTLFLRHYSHDRYIQNIHTGTILG